MVHTAFALVVVVVLFLAANAGADTPAERAQALVDKMTLNQKLGLVHGSRTTLYIGTVEGVPVWGIPQLHLEDGPQGVGDEVSHVTCWPTALSVTASWDKDLFYQFGAAMGEEHRIKGSNMMLGPMNNLVRVPTAGRNFETTGEDPNLASAYVSQVIPGIQSQGVIACSKHLADNNDETDRMNVSVHVDERTQYELYYPQFQAAVDAGVGSIMCSYNKVNDTWACENDHLLNQDLKGTLGFQGFVVSDWYATHSTELAANSGLDMEMPRGTYFGDALADAVAAGTVSVETIDDKALRILTTYYAVGLMDNAQTGDLQADATSEEHCELARKLSEAGTVLLKNSNNLLPLDTNKLTKIAVLGLVAHDSPIISGSGSGHVLAEYIVTPYEGIKTRATASLVEYKNGRVLSEATRLAKESDVAIIVVGVDSAEGTDRASLELPLDSDNLIWQVLDVQPNTIVVIHSPGAVLMPWEKEVPTIVESFYPGQEDGNALAAVLFGDVNPSGRLPVTFPIADAQTPLQTPEQYPGVNLVETYTEQLLVGYRWYDAKGQVPLFPFGHGLSYTSFEYTAITASNTGVSATVTNTGSRGGAEVVQLYIGFPSSAGEPPQVLRGFEKVTLAAGESTQVSFTLTPSKDLSTWDVESHSFVQQRGTFKAYVGASSRDIRLTASFTN
ncbi:glycoside hydrolase superfamily [Pelomyxa schiedti]|nr:glycoside hydrolase superfamily [Pelomyxa schiedti]